MPAVQLVLSTFWAPGKALQTAAQDRRFVLPIVVLTVVSIGFTAIAVPRIDFERSVAEQIDKTPAAAKMTPHERQTAIDTGGKLGAIASVASSVFAPVFMVVLASLFLWLGSKVAGGKPEFVPTLAVASHAMLPGALEELVSIPAILSRTKMTATDLTLLLPTNLAALVPDSTGRGPLLGLYTSMDLFGFWSLALVIVGMSLVAKLSRLRSAATCIVLWAAYVAVFKVALPALGGGASG